ncbi:unnamed protein product [Peronospora belbahrii]|uniref:Uncharacterized protein n=1 Tax=Peronospora belbahrii TaxID=622444 RepID=A0AAU9L909_9STRA|nr:unnamed protein product [Peronospora belbahrii]
MLIFALAERWSARQFLYHQWIAADAVNDVQLTTALQELRKFNARRNFGLRPRSITDSNDETLEETLSAPAAVNVSDIPPAPSAS